MTGMTWEELRQVTPGTKLLIFIRQGVTIHDNFREDCEKSKGLFSCGGTAASAYSSDAMIMQPQCKNPFMFSWKLFESEMNLVYIHLAKIKCIYCGGLLEPYKNKAVCTECYRIDE